MTNWRARRRRQLCDHPDRLQIKRRSEVQAELDARYGETGWRCPDCGLRWNERVKA